METLVIIFLITGWLAAVFIIGCAIEKAERKLKEIKKERSALISDRLSESRLRQRA